MCWSSSRVYIQDSAGRGTSSLALLFWASKVRASWNVSVSKQAPCYFQTPRCCCMKRVKLKYSWKCPSKNQAACQLHGDFPFISWQLRGFDIGTATIIRSTKCTLCVLKPRPFTADYNEWPWCVYSKMSRSSTVHRTSSGAWKMECTEFAKKVCSREDTQFATFLNKDVKVFALTRYPVLM